MRRYPPLAQDRECEQSGHGASSHRYRDLSDRRHWNLHRTDTVRTSEAHFIWIRSSEGTNLRFLGAAASLGLLAPLGR